MTRVPLVMIGAIAGALAFAPCAAAQDATVEQLVATALEGAPDIRAARTAVTAAGGQLTQAGLRPNPVLRTSEREGAFRETTIGVEWPLDLFRRPSRIAVAQQAVEATTLSVRDRERRLASAVREQAGRLLASRRRLEVMSEVLAASRRMRDLIDQRANEGEAPKLDASIAAVQLGRMEADQVLAAADAEVAAIELKALCGLPPDAPLVLRDSLESLVRGAPAAQPAQTTEAVVQARPDIREASARVALAGARVEEARRAGRFDMTLSGSYDRLTFDFAQRGFDETGRLVPIEGIFHSMTLGAMLTLPLRNRNQGAVAAAQAEQSGAQELAAARERGARAELETALVRDREAQRAVELYASAVRERARQNVDVVLEAYDLGRLPLSDLLTEQRRYLEAEAGYTDVLSRAYQARVALRLARGEIR